MYCSTNSWKCKKYGLNCSVWKLWEWSERRRNVSRKLSWRPRQTVNLLRTSVIQLISIISNYSIHHLICSLFNSGMTSTEFVALYWFINMWLFIFTWRIDYLQTSQTIFYPVIVLQFWQLIHLDKFSKGP